MMQTELQGRHDVISALTNAQLGLTFGQLWQGGAAIAKKDSDRLFGKEKLRFGIVEDYSCTEETKEENCLAVALAKIHGIEVYALLDSEASPNVI